MANAKSKILSAAEELMFSGTTSKITISDISKKAGVADSHVYQFFKGKEELLFSVAFDQMEKPFYQLKEHLEGIKDAESRLRKMIWFSLNYNNNHRGYARTLMFECRSNVDFYTTPAYQLIRRYSRVLLSILEQGVSDGTFSKDLDIYIVRDIVLGTLDFVTIKYLADEQEGSWLKDYEKILSLIIPMVLKMPEVQKTDKSDLIIAAAEKVFYEKGFARAQISEIARRANVAGGTIYEYFKNKEDLLLSIPEKRFNDQMEKIKDGFSPRKPIRKLRRLIRYHFTLHLNNREFLKVFLLNILLNNRFYSSKAYGKYNEYLDLTDAVIKEGKEDGSFREDIDSEIFKSMFLGSFSNMALRWLILEKDMENDKMEEIETLVELFSISVLSKE